MIVRVNMSNTENADFHTVIDQKMMLSKMVQCN